MMYRRPAPKVTHMGDPGIFSSIGRALGGVVRTATGVIGAVVPGPVGAIANVANRALGGGGRAPSVATAPMYNLGQAVPGVQTAPTPGFTGAVQRLMPGGATGYTACLKKDGTPRRVRRDGKCYKRPSMNPMNARAAGRAITRIKAARKILQRIERGLPKRAGRGGRGRKCGCK